MLLPSRVVRRVIPMVALLAACSGASGVSVDSTDSAVTAEDVAGTTEVVEAGTDTTTTQGSDGPSTTSSGRPVAPDFTLELSDGGSYTLSEAEKPVYLVFWAEW